MTLKKLIVICFVFISVKQLAQCAATITPTNQAVVCAGGTVSFTAAPTGSVNLNYYWYSPLSPYPAGVPIYTSTGLMSVLSGSLSPGTYVVKTTDLGNTCTDSTGFMVTSVNQYPTYSMNSATNYSVGCAPLNQTTLSIINPVSTQTPPSTCSFTFLPPGFGGTLAPGPYGASTSTITTLPGTWTVIVYDNTNFCKSVLPLIISQNTVAPNLSINILTQTLTCNDPTLLATGTSTTPNTTISWMQPTPPPLVSASTIIIGPGSGPNTSTTSLTYANYTVIGTNSVTACQSTSVIVISQNFKPPISSPTFAIASPTIIDCNTGNPVVLTTGTSTTTSGAGPLSFIVNPCWESPGTPTPICGNTSYTCTASGVQSLTVKDNYNGCSSTGTINILSGGSLTPSFVHTVGVGGLVNFVNNSPGTNTNTISNWNFGDGFTASGNSVSHTYVSAGAYSVSLSANNGGGCAGSILQSVNVTGIGCLANSGFSVASTPTPQYWTATPNYPYNVIAASWDWGDGSNSNTLYASHIYSAAAIYNICLSVTVSCAGSSSSCASQFISRSATQNMAMININVIAPTTTVVGIKNSEMEEPGYIIYPNPNNGEFNLQLTGANSGNINVSVYDVIGEKIYDSKQEITNGEFEKTIDLRERPNGIYFVKTSVGNQSLTRKIIVNR